MCGVPTASVSVVLTAASVNVRTSVEVEPARADAVASTVQALLRNLNDTAESFDTGAPVLAASAVGRTDLAPTPPPPTLPPPATKFGLTFVATGCCDLFPGVAYWYTRTDAQVFADMHAYCSLVRDGAATASQVAVCGCGDTPPSSCTLQTSFALPAGYSHPSPPPPQELASASSSAPAPSAPALNTTSVAIGFVEELNEDETVAWLLIATLVPLGVALLVAGACLWPSIRERCDALRNERARRRPNHRERNLVHIKGPTEQPTQLAPVPTGEPIKRADREPSRWRPRRGGSAPPPRRAPVEPRGATPYIKPSMPAAETDTETEPSIDGEEAIEPPAPFAPFAPPRSRLGNPEPLSAGAVVFPSFLEVLHSAPGMHKATLEWEAARPSPTRLAAEPPPPSRRLTASAAPPARVATGRPPPQALAALQRAAPTRTRSRGTDKVLPPVQDVRGVQQPRYSLPISSSRLPPLPPVAQRGESVRPSRPAR